EPHQISLFWGLAFHIINDIGFSMSYAIGMAMYSRAAPVSLNTIFVACFSLHLFMANLTIGKLSTLIGHIGDVPFWLLHSGASLVAGVILLMCSIVFRSLLAPENVPSGRDNPSHIL
ncbi:peptide transporter, partial [Gluconobacter japonicus]